MNTKLWIVTPFEAPDVSLAEAAARTGAFPVLHLGRNHKKAEEDLRSLIARSTTPIGVCIADEKMLDLSFPAKVQRIILPWGMKPPTKKHKAEIAWQIHSATEAEEALAANARVLILKGSEGAGMCGEDSSFLMFQQLRDRILAAGAELYIQGGAGIHSAAAYIALGATGVIMDSQVALLPECGCPQTLKDAFGRLNGSEIQSLDGYRYYHRPGASEPGEKEKLLEILMAEGVTEKADFVPAGQDVVLAADYLKYYKRLKHVVRAVEKATYTHVKLSKTRDALGAGSAMAKLLGTEYPIAQGPMARISDVPEFLKDVADGGALPFLAMSLMTGNAAEEALEKTAKTMDGKPWGVGILGFAYPKIVEEQTKLILQTKPSAVLIAGGRPTQARIFEKEGIQVFIHVPATSLLEMFLKEEAKSFIFEGRECGGHVGPLYSTVLWEKQINCIMSRENAVGMNLFFAGGIHDALSATFVRLMSAPLTAKGASVGVIMGTVYLYTDEIVKRKAITEDYRRMLIEKNETVLLRSGHGQETRSVPSEYTEFFQKERDRLVKEGVDSGEILMKLEDMNLGRTRIAAKGIERQKDKLVSISTADQLKNGLYMTGSITSLIRKKTKISDIHEDVILGSAAMLDGIPVPEKNVEKLGGTDVAVIGMASIFPDAADIDEYWRNIIFGKDSTREVPKERWDTDLFYDPDAKDNDHVVSKWGCFIGATDFDALEFGITPQSLAAIEPVQLLSLLVAKRALEDAGFADLNLVDLDDTSVIFGAQCQGELASSYGSRGGLRQFFGDLPEELDEVLPRLTEDSFPGVLGNVIAGRISNRLNTGGRNFTVDAACASSLAALDIAYSELSEMKSDMVVLGGSDLHNSIYDFLMFNSTYALSKKGYCSTFDSDADGIALGEGIGVLILKRLEDAERDGNKIYAVIRGIGGSSDGKNLGLTAPSRNGQILALERAYANAGIKPSDVGLLEAHGTGTVVGDRIEMSALTDVFLYDGTPSGRVQLGSIKTNIGHTKCAAGVAGLIKAILSVHHGILPPTLHLKKPNEAFIPNGPFMFRTEKAGYWNESRRIAGVSGFGFGGTNFHAIVENYVPERPRTPLKAWPSELFVFPGKTKEDGKALMEMVRVLYETNDKLRLRDVAYSLSLRCEKKTPIQYAIVAGSRDLLLERMEAALADKADKHVYPLNPLRGKVAFLFSGQGSQRVNMAADLFMMFPAMRRLLGAHSEYEEILFPVAAFTEEDKKAQRTAVTDTRNAQPLLGLVDLAIAELLWEMGIEADMTAGHSYGELPALCYAGAFKEDALVELSRQRAEAILTAAGDDPGAMAAVRADADAVKKLLKGVKNVWAVNLNSQKQTVVAGTTEDLDAFLAKLDEEKVAFDKLNVAAAFHSPILKNAEGLFAETLKKVSFKKPSMTVWSNTTAEAYPATAAGIRTRLAEHLVSPVLFAKEIEAMYEAGARVFIEAGPGGVLTGLTGTILKEKEIETIQTERGGEEGLSYLLRGLAKYISTGRLINMEKVFEGREAEALQIDKPELYKKNGTVWNIDGKAAVPESGELPAHAGKLMSGPVLSIEELQRKFAGATVESIMMAYLDNIGSVIQDQRDVMLGYLGQPDMIPRASTARRQYDFVQEAAPALAEAGAGAAVAAAPAEAAGSALPAISSLSNEQISDIILEIVSEKTGYPIDMLGLDMDLEADLSIDSIKKMEIVGGLNEKVALPNMEDGMDEFFERMISIKTFRELIGWIEEIGAAIESGTLEQEEEEFQGAQAAITIEDVDATNVSVAGKKPMLTSESAEIVRMTLSERPVPIDVKDESILKGKTFAVTDDGKGLAESLVKQLTAAGGKARTVQADAEIQDCDGLVLINTATATNHYTIFDLFTLLKGADMKKLQWIFTFDDIPGALVRSKKLTKIQRLEGFAGFAKSLMHEYPEKAIAAVTFHTAIDGKTFPALAFSELTNIQVVPEVFYRDAERLCMVPSIEKQQKPNGKAGDKVLKLDKDANIIVLGGAQGITPHLVSRLVNVYPCNYILVGRSEQEALSDDYKDMTDLNAIKKQLIEKDGMKSPREIESKAKSIQKVNQIAASMALIGNAGGTVSYASVDVRDPKAFSAFIGDMKKKLGHVDGVIQAAGILEDKLFRDKEIESFRRVYTTKAAPIETILRELPDLKLLVFFSSTSASFGNAGQCDYAAGNSVLDLTARILKRQRPEIKTIAFNWGPWKGAGMVNAGLEAEFKKKGISFLQLDKGGEFFVNEITGESEAEGVIAIAGDEKEMEGFIQETLRRQTGS